MIKFLSLVLLSSLHLYGGGFWTLTGLQKANVYLSNELSILKSDTAETIKQKMSDKLKKDGIQTDAQDSPTLMLSLKEIEGDEIYYIYVELALGEEVQTFREDKSKTFALTYSSNDFIEVDREELDKGILESVDFLLSQFSEQFEEDKE